MSNAYRAVVSAGGGAAVGDATAADVLTGKTFSGAVGSGVAGTMPNNGAVSGTASPGNPYTIPAGYHNGSGQVTASATGFDCVIGTDSSYAFVVDNEKSLRASSADTFVFTNFTVTIVNGTTLKFNKACTVYPSVSTPIGSLNNVTPSQVNANTNITLTGIAGVIFD